MSFQEHDPWFRPTHRWNKLFQTSHRAFTSTLLKGRGKRSLRRVPHPGKELAERRNEIALVSASTLGSGPFDVPGRMSAVKNDR